VIGGSSGIGLAVAQQAARAAGASVNLYRPDACYSSAIIAPPTGTEPFQIGFDGLIAPGCNLRDT
jgi:hypothetical protein